MHQDIDHSLAAFVWRKIGCGLHTSDRLGTGLIVDHVRDPLTIVPPIQMERTLLVHLRGARLSAAADIGTAVSGGDTDAGRWRGPAHGQSTTFVPVPVPEFDRTSLTAEIVRMGPVNSNSARLAFV